MIRRAQGDLAGARADLEKALEITPATWRARAQVEGMLAEVKALQK